MLIQKNIGKTPELKKQMVGRKKEAEQQYRNLYFD